MKCILRLCDIHFHLHLLVLLLFLFVVVSLCSLLCCLSSLPAWAYRGFIFVKKSLAKNQGVCVCIFTIYLCNTCLELVTRQLATSPQAPKIHNRSADTVSVSIYMQIYAYIHTFSHVVWPVSL